MAAFTYVEEVTVRTVEILVKLVHFVLRVA